MANISQERQVSNSTSNLFVHHYKTQVRFLQRTPLLDSRSTWAKKGPGRSLVEYRGWIMTAQRLQLYGSGQGVDSTLGLMEESLKIG